MRIFSKDSVNGYTNFLFNLLPQYFRDNDSYPSDNGDGTFSGFLERFLEAFCNELDEGLSPQLSPIPNIYNFELQSSISEADQIFFYDYLASFWDIVNLRWIADKSTYIKLIKNYQYIARVKGTKLALERYLFLFGYEITTFTLGTIDLNYYDSSLSYDDSNTYDLGNPIFYLEYDMEITRLGAGSDLTAAQLLQLKTIINNHFNPSYILLNNLTENI